jgi:uncharacterized NAD(P)/FAD-binding protein YdhS
MQVYDLVFVGSGLSSSSTLYHILNGLQKQSPNHPVKKIAVIERDGEFWKGIAYGSRTSIHSLTINPVKDFFQDTEKPLFFNWLNAQRANDMPGIADAHKSVMKNWLTDNADSLNATDLDGLYIPRFLYGIYLAQKLENMIADCKKNHIAHIDLISGEAIDAEKVNGTEGYTIDVQTIDGIVTLSTKVLVLGTGSLDTRKITSGLQTNYLCIDDVYDPTLEINLKKISETLLALSPEKRDMMVIGSNASASEMVHILYKLSKAQPGGLNKIYILSTSGLPDRLYVNSDYGYVLENLNALEEAGNYTADALITAIVADVKNTEKKGLSVGKIHYSLSEKAIGIQNKFTPEEAQKFFNDHGWTFTRVTRRTSESYYFTEKELVDAGKLEFIKGRFVKLCDEQNHAGGLKFIYKAVNETAEKEFEKAFPIIINCAGAEDIAATTSKLLRNLLDKHILEINNNRMGIAVDETFAANHNLYIIGPTIAGIYNAKFKFWHLENAKRLNTLAPILAGTVLAKIA